MESNEQVLDNAPLLQAIARMQTENSRESREAVLDLVISQAQFLAPADIVPETEGTEGKEAALRFQLLTNQEGQPFFPAFTGWEDALCLMRKMERRELFDAMLAGPGAGFLRRKPLPGNRRGDLLPAADGRGAATRLPPASAAGNREGTLHGVFPD